MRNIVNLRTTERCLDKLRKIAAAGNGKLLSTEWKGIKEKYLFEFSDGRQFERSASETINRGFPKNADVYLRISQQYLAYKDRSDEEYLEIMKNLAKRNNGKLVSTVWEGATKKYLFQDKDGFQFLLNYACLKIGQWNANRGYVSEPVCRQVMEYIFGYEFPKTRKILIPAITMSSKPLELDGYCKELKIAFEYQGHPSHWDKTNSIYEKVHEKDLLKKKCAKKLGITLVQIPPLNSYQWKSHEVIDFILKILKKEPNIRNRLSGLDLNGFSIDFNKINTINEYLLRIAKIAERNNGKLLSTKWRGQHYKYLFEFKDGRQFEMTASHIRRRGFPKDPDLFFSISNTKCQSDKELYTELKEIAIKNKAKLLTEEWKGNYAYYVFEAECGTQFKRTAYRIKNYKFPKFGDKVLLHYRDR